MCGSQEKGILNALCFEAVYSFYSLRFENMLLLLAKETSSLFLVLPI